MPKLTLKSGFWSGSIPNGESFGIRAGEVVEVTQEQADYLLGDVCSGDFELAKDKAAKAAKE